MPAASPISEQVKPIHDAYHGRGSAGFSMFEGSEAVGGLRERVVPAGAALTRYQAATAPLACAASMVFNWRLTALSTALNEAVRMLLSVAAPNMVGPLARRSST